MADSKAVCDCCSTGDSLPTHANAAGLSSIAFRIGTHGEFLDRMLRRVSSFQLPDGPSEGRRPLLSLATRETTDPAVAMLDAWAAACDVLTFYAERIANECFLRTATERESVLALARAIGYELSPGVAASAALEFTVEDAPGSPRVAAVAAGLKVQSIPGPGEMPQTFETSEAGDCKAEWNRMLPALTTPQALGGRSQMLVAGSLPGLSPGAALLFTTAEGSDVALRRISTVTTSKDFITTTVAWKDALPATFDGNAYVLRQGAGWFGSNAPDWRAMPASLKKAYLPTYNEDVPSTDPGEWPGFALATPASAVSLDGDYPGVAPGTWLLIAQDSSLQVAKISAVSLSSMANFALSGRVTTLSLDRTVTLSGLSRRGVVLYFIAEPLPLAPVPLAVDVTGEEVELGDRLPLLPDGRQIALHGKRKRLRFYCGGSVKLWSADGLTSTVVSTKEGFTLLEAPAKLPSEPAEHRRYHLLSDNGAEGFIIATPLKDVEVLPPKDTDPVVAEIVDLKHAADAPGGPTTLTFSNTLRGVYERSTVWLNGNVLGATHGETQAEVLGGGDGAQANQSFPLRKAPLTYTPASTPSGGESTLRVWVNGVEWQQLQSLYGLSPESTSYTAETQGDGTTLVIFGDGRSGARLPTGTENVAARYRQGIGSIGLVGAGKVSLLQQRPFGMRSVSNPLPSEGAADPELLEDARRNAPMKVKTLGRVVSLADYGDFAAAFSGVGKARVDLLWAGGRLINLTLGDANGEPVAPNAKLLGTLATAMGDVAAAVTPFRLSGYRKVFFRVQVAVTLDPRYVAESVVTRLRTLVGDAYTFARREFAQAVTAAGIIALLQGVPGVLGVDLSKLYRADDADGPAQQMPPPALLAHGATAAGTEVFGAELLLLDPQPAGLVITVVS